MSSRLITGRRTVQLLEIKLQPQVLVLILLHATAQASHTLSILMSSTMTHLPGRNRLWAGKTPCFRSFPWTTSTASENKSTLKLETESTKTQPQKKRKKTRIEVERQATFSAAFLQISKERCWNLEMTQWIPWTKVTARTYETILEAKQPLFNWS